MCENIDKAYAAASKIYFAFRGLALSLLGGKPLPAGTGRVRRPLLRHGSGAIN